MKNKLVKKLTKAQIPTLITVSIICFVLSLCFTIQVRTININEGDIIRLKKENELREEIVQWREIYEQALKKNDEFTKKIEEYRSAASKNDDTVKIIKKELDDANILAGVSKVRGKGITVTLDDTSAIEEVTESSGFYNPNVYVIHDTDVLSVINELFAAGAEAIEVNGQRIIATTAIRCVGPVIQINGTNLSTPYTISAIGEPKTLSGALKLRGGIISEMKRANIDVTIEEKDDIVIPAYDRVLKYQYATPVLEVD